MDKLFIFKIVVQLFFAVIILNQAEELLNLANFTPAIYFTSQIEHIEEILTN
jgi:hypothetical protein